MEESGSTFNKVNEQSGVGEDPFTTFDTRSSSTPIPPTTTSAPRSPSTTTTHSTTIVAHRSPYTKTPPTTTAAPRSPSTTTSVTAANPSIEDADDLVSGPVESDFLEEGGSDYSTEDSVESECGLVGDDNEDYGSDVHEEVKELRAEKRSFQRRKRKERVPADTEEVPVGEAGADLDFDETQTGKISVEGRLGGDEPYFASSDDGSFEIDEDEFSDECVESERSTVRTARAKVLKDIMGDHIVEFGKILDYKDELLRTNPGSTCVVKLGEPDAFGRPIFQSFYICFDPLKKAFQNCRKCIGLDGCFLKGVCREQLLVVVAKDGNNQMLPLAWAVVEYEKKETWTWFIKLLKEDLGLGDGEDLTLITDMQKHI
ncbi:hypothetical protein KY285_019293 [Solanum tuberosum]|nr:hypothetical protein KY285_019293 [Solanum tuberosum]